MPDIHHSININASPSSVDALVTTPFFVSCNTTWGGLMFRLRSAAEGKPSGPLFQKNSLAY